MRPFPPDELDQLFGPHRTAAASRESSGQRLRTIARNQSPPPAHIGQQGQGDAHLTSLEARPIAQYPPAPAPREPAPEPVRQPQSGQRRRAEQAHDEPAAVNAPPRAYADRRARDQDDPDMVVSATRWTTRSDYEAYLQWRDGTGDTTMFRELLVRDMEISYYDEVLVVTAQ